MSTRFEALRGALAAALASRIRAEVADRGQLTIEVAADDLPPVMSALRDDERLAFSELIDLAGVDYQGFGEEPWEGKRYAVVYNLLSIRHNWRVRVKVFCTNDEFPALDSVIGVWPGANWFEREAFDLYGIVFKGHRSEERRVGKECRL